MNQTVQFVIRSVPVEILYPLRQAILRPEQTYTFSMYPSDRLPSTLHLAAYWGNEIIGIASVYLESPGESQRADAWRLRDMGVVETMRGKGCGRLLLNTAIDYIRSRNGHLFWCYARETAVPFYIANGFRCHGEPFDLLGFGQRFFLSRELNY